MKKKLNVQIKINRINAFLIRMLKPKSKGNISEPTKMIPIREARSIPILIIEGLRSYPDLS